MSDISVLVILLLIASPRYIFALNIVSQYRCGFVKPVNNDDNCGLTQDPIKISKVYDIMQCSWSCLKHEGCLGYNWNEQTRVCGLHNTTSLYTLGLQPGFSFYPSADSSMDHQV